MLPQRYFYNRVHSIVTELRCKVTTAEVCEKFSIEKLSIAAENVAVLNDFIIEDLSELPNEVGVPIPQCRESIWLWKVFNELLRSSFPQGRTGVYSGKVRLGDAGTRRWKRGVPSFVICFCPDTAIYQRKMYLLFEIKCAKSEWPIVCLACLVAMLIKLLGIESYRELISIKSNDLSTTVIDCEVAKKRLVHLEFKYLVPFHNKQTIF